MAHKLLLADDSVTIQRVIELTFADEDIQVVAVGDGQQAIDRLPAERPDIVLADIGMPERDGYEVAAFIRNSPEFSHIPVLLLTGAFEPIDEGRAREVGCDGVLVKPFEPQMVISRVKELLSGKRPPRPAAAAPAPSSDALRAAPAGERAGTTPEGAGGSTGSIEDYFDRLDAAFGSVDAAGQSSASAPVPAAQPGGKSVAAPSLSDELAHWDPDLGTPSASRDTVLSLDDLKDEPAPPAPAASDASVPGQAPQTFSFTPATPIVPAAPPATAPLASMTSSVPATPTTQTPSMSPPSLAEAFAALLAAEQGHAAPAQGPPQVSEEVIDQVTRRVIEKLGDRAVRDIVLEVAERLVREEIERIKQSADHR